MIKQISSVKIDALIQDLKLKRIRNDAALFYIDIKASAHELSDMDLDSVKTKTLENDIYLELIDKLSELIGE